MARFCSNCGAALNEGARFCHACGLAVGSAGPTPLSRENRLFWAPTAIALLAVIAMVAYQAGSLERQQSQMVIGAPQQAGGPPDISSMTPQEQADRLFDRVMRLASEGKADSAAFFAPMAMGAIESLGPLDAHRRYDVGLIAMATGDVPMAAAHADTILASRATHLLGLALAMKAADARGDQSAAAAFRKRLLDAAPAERATGLEEYDAHSRDIDDALAAARRR